MRTTIDINDDLFRRAKEAAARSNRPLREVVEDALRLAFAQASVAGAGKLTDLSVSTRKPGLCPGVDLDDSAGLLDLMEGRNGPA